jgi:PUA domain protein
MAPGLVSAGGHVPDPSQAETPLEKGRAVAIMAQDKESALSIGILKESTEEIRAKGKGIVVDNLHCLGGESYDARAL